MASPIIIITPPPPPKKEGASASVPAGMTPAEVAKILRDAAKSLDK